MQATQHNNVFSQDSQNRIGYKLITTRQALVIAFAACNSCLTGKPHPATFEADDLRQTLIILTQMVCTIEGGQQ